jgi:hypothetical protein
MPEVEVPDIVSIVCVVGFCELLVFLFFLVDCGMAEAMFWQLELCVNELEKKRGSSAMILERRVEMVCWNSSAEKRRRPC